MPIVEADGGMLAPGFVDLQVNGGGGVMLNDRPDVDDDPHHLRRARAVRHDRAAADADHRHAGESPRRRSRPASRRRGCKVPGFLGLHLEGPHLSRARKGAHDPALIRPMTDADEAALIAARRELPVLLTTVAPEIGDAASRSRRSPRPASSSASAIPTRATARPSGAAAEPARRWSRICSTR